jgi:hypothetical protein
MPAIKQSILNHFHKTLYETLKVIKTFRVSQKTKKSLIRTCSF